MNGNARERRGGAAWLLVCVWAPARVGQSRTIGCVATCVPRQTCWHYRWRCHPTEGNADLWGILLRHRLLRDRNSNCRQVALGFIPSGAIGSRCRPMLPNRIWRAGRQVLAGPARRGRQHAATCCRSPAASARWRSPRRSSGSSPLLPPWDSAAIRSAGRAGPRLAECRRRCSQTRRRGSA